MARLPRYTLPGQPQHVIQRGNNHAALFATDIDYRFFRECLPDEATLEDIHYHLYVLEKIRRGESRATNEGTLTQDEAEARLRKWITK